MTLLKQNEVRPACPTVSTWGSAWFNWWLIIISISYDSSALSAQWSTPAGISYLPLKIDWQAESQRNPSQPCHSSHQDAHNEPCGISNRPIVVTNNAWQSDLEPFMTWSADMRSCVICWESNTLLSLLLPSSSLFKYCGKYWRSTVSFSCPASSKLTDTDTQVGGHV